MSVAPGVECRSIPSSLDAVLDSPESSEDTIEIANQSDVINSPESVCTSTAQISVETSKLNEVSPSDVKLDDPKEALTAVMQTKPISERSDEMNHDNGFSMLTLDAISTNGIERKTAKPDDGSAVRLPKDDSISPAAAVAASDARHSSRSDGSHISRAKSDSAGSQVVAGGRGPLGSCDGDIDTPSFYKIPDPVRNAPALPADTTLSNRYLRRLQNSSSGDSSLSDVEITRARIERFGRQGISLSDSAHLDSSSAELQRSAHDKKPIDSVSSVDSHVFSPAPASDQQLTNIRNDDDGTSHASLCDVSASSVDGVVESVLNSPTTNALPDLEKRIIRQMEVGFMNGCLSFCIFSVKIIHVINTISCMVHCTNVNAFMLILYGLHNAQSTC